MFVPRLILILAVSIASQAQARALEFSQDAQVLLWPKGAPEAKGEEPIDQPALTIHLPDPDKATGTGVIVNPGGGYRILAADHEGLQVARELNRQGIAAFVLRYRLEPKYATSIALLDGQRAVRYVRHHAKALGIDPDRVGMLGFSAGGHLTAAVGTSFDRGIVDSADPIDRQSCRPDFLVPVYPAIAKELFPPDRQGSMKWGSLHELVTEDTPPAFLVHTHEDNLSPNHSVFFYQALLAKRIQAEIHVFGRGPHGTGLAPGDPDLGHWPQLLNNWLRRNGLLTGEKRHAISGSIHVDGEPLYWGWVTLTPEDDRQPVVNAYMGWNDEGKFKIPAETGPCLGKHHVKVHVVATDFSEKQTGHYSMRDARVYDAEPLFLTRGKLDRLRIQAGKITRKDYPPEMPESEAHVYKTIDDVKLQAYVFKPEGHQATDQRPAAVFFFGGGWKSGTPAQFHQQCRYLAARGVVAITADYRILHRQGTKAIASVRDAKSAIRWVRQHASELGIDPDKIVAGGGSAGGHLAACTGVIAGLDEPGEDTRVSSVPNAMTLFNPAVVLSPIDGEHFLRADRLPELRERMGIEPSELSPYHHVKPGAPPTIIFHGIADKSVAYRSVEMFTEAMTRSQNHCALLGYEDQGHGFFNPGRGNNSTVAATVNALDRFLVSLGFLDPGRSPAALTVLKQAPKGD